MEKIEIYRAQNEPVLSYKKGSEERLNVEFTYNNMFNSKVDIPLYIGSKKILTPERKNILPPHDHKNIVGTYSLANKKNVDDAIDNLLSVKESWSTMNWKKRCDIFLLAADLVSGKYRAKITAGTMIGQSKNIFQAEIDAACEFADFLRFNVSYLTEIYNEQPIDGPGKTNILEYRPLEGFVYSVTPFNFTAIGGNLCASAALMGNVILWKPSDNQMYTAKIIMDIFEEAGLPSGVINLVSGDPILISDIALSHPEFSGLHFTGSTHVFKELWKKIGNNIFKYRDYPRIVGETGGKDFIFCHPSAKIDSARTAIIRGGFEYQGQKCSAASRIYIPESISKKLIDKGAQLIGLGARDTLRLEAGLCLYGHELDINKTPVEANLRWAISKSRLSNGGFIGSKKIMNQMQDGASQIRVGIKPEGRLIAREKTKIFNDTDKQIGEITSGTFGPSVNGPIAMGYVDKEFSKVDTETVSYTHLTLPTIYSV